MVSELSTSKVIVLPVNFDEDLHTTPQTADEVQCGFLLDIIVSKGSAVLKPNFQSDRLASKGFEKDGGRGAV
jgi:hypothetical protein